MYNIYQYESLKYECRNQKNINNNNKNKLVKINKNVPKLISMQQSL